MRGYDRFDWVPFGIARECARRDAAKNSPNPGRTGSRVLVEVKAHHLTAAKRRVILLHCLHAQAGRWASGCDGFSGGLRHCGLLFLRRVRMASACPVRPSAFAINAAFGPRARRPCAEYCWTVMSL